MTIQSESGLASERRVLCVRPWGTQAVELTRRCGDHPLRARVSYSRMTIARWSPKLNRQARLGTLAPWFAITVSVIGGTCVAAQALVNGRLADDIGTPVTAALVSNGLATVLLATAACVLSSIRVGLRRLRNANLPWWQYIGGCLGAFLVAGAAYAAPRLGVALYSITLASGTALGGVASDRVGLGPVGKVPLAWRRLAGATLAIIAVSVAESHVPFRDVAIGVLAFVLLLGFTRSVQSALNGRISQAAINVGSASLVNAVLGTTVLGVAAGVLLGTGHLRFDGWPDQWWPYTGGVLALIITGANLVAVRTIGVLRTGLASLTGQLGGSLLLEALVRSSMHPTIWLAIATAITILAVVVSNPKKKPET